jgi:hypothetical protein
MNVEEEQLGLFMSCSDMYIPSVNVFHIAQSEYFFMPVIFCKECRESIYLNPHAYWTISDTSVKCDKCNATNTITLENGELKNKYRLRTD